MWIIITRKKLFKLLLIILSIFFLLIMFQIFFNKASSIKTDLNSKGYIVLIIDDFGNHGDGTDEMMDLNIPITAAVMPFMPYSSSDAEAAYNANLEVIMHLAMEPNVGKKEWLGPRGITCDLSNEEVKSIVYDGLKEIKYATGINNHMGSKATQDKRIMKAILEVAKDKNLFFVDSKTSPKSVISETAEILEVPCLTRDVFLDGTKDTAHIRKQILKLGDIALKRGYAIGIGHVGVEGGKATAQAIKSAYPLLSEKGIGFITVKQLIAILNK
ncbi:MAG: divergent polysaccharide deacetylase family protein [Maledivibacter sp.]|nr:divergent polysaccharide deacetylase family protein [Maledivibacter sp.]